MTAASVNVDGNVLCEKADNVVLSLGNDSFQASGVWVHRFKQQHRLVYRVVSGEAKKVDESQVNDWLNTLPAPISDYAPCDIFNANEAGLFFNLQPEKSPCVKGQACQGALTEDNEEHDADLHIEGWQNLKTEASPQDFVTADDNVATCGLQSIEELVDEVREMESDSDGEDADVGDLASMSENHHALDVLRRTISTDNVSEKNEARFYAFQAVFLNRKSRKVRRNIMDFFSKK
ncbi:hypothetical protein HPB51_009583 [Rhipicephalus microplus]|uniref:HTH CENPB-type domain-containing protein n=1 Tax=Rhipicephalus microplus TaxID=6941 RepID=A0A9J6D4N2_RHIMP|nr:hypothetical protein HPB51_009583 [Rhipicephalus microplus]